MVTAIETEARQELKFARKIDASPKEVFRAFIAPTALRGWLCSAAQVAAHNGGRIYLWWSDGYYAAGEFTDFHPGEMLAFTWNGRGDPSPTEVRVELTEKDGATHLTLTHSGIGPGPEWSDTTRAMRDGWEKGLENLQSYLETGVDLRIARRPMFGLNNAEFMTSELAEKLGTPVSEGLRLLGLVEGMGAQRAGFQKDDVVVAVDGHRVTDFESFTRSLDGHQAGDTIPVEFYRGAEKQTIEVELSPRPRPEIPATTSELADLLAETHAQINAELDECVSKMTDEEASYHPEPDAWNAKEVLAHLIASEQDSHAWVAALDEDAEWETVFHANTLIRLQGITAVHPTIVDLAEELKRAQAVTLAIARALPEKVFTRKADYYNLAQWWTTFADHHREHFAEIKRFAEASRAS